MPRADHQRFRIKKRVGLILLPLMVANILVTTTPASAHCPTSGSGYYYVAGDNDANIVRATSTDIEWISDPTACGLGTFYSASLTKDDGWLQVGWGYYDYYVKPLGYCERQPATGGNGEYALDEYVVPEATLRYTYFRAQNADLFECRIDGDVKRVTHGDWIGFYNADRVVVQAEAHRFHAQLGRIDPRWFDFTTAQKVVQGTTVWSQMHVNNVFSSASVWNYQTPYDDGFRVNTDATH